MSNTEQQTLQTLTGHRLGPYLSFNPVNRVQIWQWCSAMGDRNPLYRDNDYSKRSEFGGVVAPPAMMQMWTMRDFNDSYAPGSTDAPPYQVFDEMRALGYPGNVAVSYDISFHRYLREGERPLHFTTVVNISERKSTALGEGFFVTECVDYSTVDDHPFAQALITYFQYQPKQATNTEQQKPAVTPPTARPENRWQPDFKDLDSSQINIGDALPVLPLPITHRLIVGGAIATQDFIPVHHNVEAAKAAAMPDIFMNILTTSGLAARYLSDWAGAGSRLKKLAFRLLAPNLPGDTMTLQGKVTSLQQHDTALADVEFAGKNSLGFHVTGSASIALSQ